MKRSDFLEVTEKHDGNILRILLGPYIIREFIRSNNTIGVDIEKGAGNQPISYPRESFDEILAQLEENEKKEFEKQYIERVEKEYENLQKRFAEMKHQSDNPTIQTNLEPEYDDGGKLKRPFGFCLKNGGVVDVSGGREFKILIKDNPKTPGIE